MKELFEFFKDVKPSGKLKMPAYDKEKYPVDLLVMVDGKISCVDHFRDVKHCVDWIHDGWFHDTQVIRAGHVTANNGHTTLLIKDGYFLP